MKRQAQTPEQLIEAGIENIEKYGHFTGFFGSREEGFCAVGSIRAACQAPRDWETYCAAERKLSEAIKASGYTLWSSEYTAVIPAFNDDPAHTKEDVILMMKRAIAND